MRRWRISQRNWEIDLLTHEGQNGNTIIFAPDVTDRDIEDAVKDLRQQNADDKKVQVDTEYIARPVRLVIRTPRKHPLSPAVDQSAPNSFRVISIDSQFNYLVSFASHLIILSALHSSLSLPATVCFNSGFSKPTIAYSCLEQHRLIISSSFAYSIIWSCLHFHSQMSDTILSSELAITLRRSSWSHTIFRMMRCR